MITKKSRNGELAGDGHKSLGAPNMPNNLILSGTIPISNKPKVTAISRNGALNRKDLSTNAFKPTSNTLPIDFNAINNGPTLNMAFGTGRFFQGLRSELKQTEHEDLMLPSFEAAKYSAKRNGIISGYGANTNQGIIR